MATAVHPRDTTRPRWRGLLHLYATGVAVVCGAVLVVLAPGARAKWGCAVYAVTVTLLFGISALYHRRTWTPAARLVMKRLDHSMIFVFIAGTYTAFSLSLLHGTKARIVLSVVWGGALVGITLRMLWLHAPRGLIIPLYIGLGWVAVFVLGDLLHYGGVAVLVLLCVGGLFYSAGAVVYATRRPDPLPGVFGYHEVFHAATVIAATCHYVAVFLAVFARAA